MWDERRKHLPPWPREREILANFIHEEQNTNTCPKSNVLDAKNMGTTKRIFLNLRRTTKTREKGKKLIWLEIKEEDKNKKKEDPPDLYCEYDNLIA